MTKYIVPFSSGIVTSVLKIFIDVIVLYLTERILDYVEARVARRKLISNGKYTYSSRRLRLPIVGRLDIGGDAQIRTKRRTIILMLIFITTAILELNINGVSQRVTRPLTREEVGDNDILLGPVQPLSTVREIKHMMQSTNSFSKWEDGTLNSSFTMSQVYDITLTYMRNAVQIHDGMTSLRSILCKLKFRNETIGRGEDEDTEVFSLWSLKTVLFVNEVVDAKFRGEGSLYKIDTSDFEKDYDGKENCNFLVRVAAQGGTRDFHDNNTIEQSDVAVSGSNDTMICDNHILFDGKRLWWQIKSSYAKEKIVKNLLCSRINYDDQKFPSTISYYEIRLAEIKSQLIEARSQISHGNSTRTVILPRADCWKLAERPAAYPVPFQVINRLQRYASATTKRLMIPYWLHLISPTKNVTGFRVYKYSRQVTEIDSIALIIWGITLFLTIIYLISTSVISMKKDRLGEKIKLDLEDAAHLANSWRSEIHDNDEFAQTRKNAALVFQRIGRNLLKVTTGSVGDKPNEDDTIVNSSTNACDLSSTLRKRK